MASQASGEPSASAGEEELVTLPLGWYGAELRRIASFAGPALSVPLFDPLMTLIDTLCVGRSGTMLELAALGPNTVVFNALNYGLSILGGVSVLSVVSRTLAEGRRDKAELALSHALAVAMLAGVLVSVLLQFFTSRVVMLGGAARGVAYFGTAASYLRIRALSFPAMLTVAVSQSALLAQRDSRTPALSVLVAAVVNITCDLLFICVFGLGAVGAAWATLLAQVVGAAFLLWVMPRRGRLPASPQLPGSWRDLMPFATVFGPLAVLKITKNLCYGLLQSSATALGAVACAAHQSAWVLWIVFCFFVEPLSSAAQALMPERIVAVEREPESSASRRYRLELRASMWMLLGLSLVIGLLLAVITVALIVGRPQLFAKEAILWPVMATVAVPAAVSTVLSAVTCPIDGVLIARRKVRYMAACMVIIFGILLLGFRRLRLAAAAAGLAGAGAFLPQVWWWLCVFFALRVAFALPMLGLWSA